jgi:hypothetical protein
MTLLGKNKKEDPAAMARWITLDMDLQEIIKVEKEQNILFKDLIRGVREMITANQEFVNVIQNFFAIEKKLHIEEAMRREKKEQDMDESPGDRRY